MEVIHSCLTHCNYFSLPVSAAKPFITERVQNTSSLMDTNKIPSQTQIYTKLVCFPVKQYHIWLVTFQWFDGMRLVSKQWFKGQITVIDLILEAQLWPLNVPGRHELVGNFWFAGTSGRLQMQGKCSSAMFTGWRHTRQMFIYNVCCDTNKNCDPLQLPHHSSSPQAVSRRISFAA